MLYSLPSDLCKKFWAFVSERLIFRPLESLKDFVKDITADEIAIAYINTKTATATAVGTVLVLTPAAPVSVSVIAETGISSFVNSI